MKQSLVDKITAVLVAVPLVQHLARKKFVAQFIVALINSRKVQFPALAQHLNDAAKVSSNQTRIEDFFREVELDYHLVALLLLTFLPRQGKCRLCIDRTEWNFGRYQANILLITIGCGAVQLPLYWELLDNRSGNSNAGQRIALLEHCLRVVDKKRWGVVLGDREFVGHAWLKYLKDNGIKFIMRMPRHHQLTTAHGGVHRVETLALPGQRERLFAQCQVDGVWGSAWVKRLDTGDFLFLFGTVNPAWMGQLYRKRWTIESCFQNLKGRGFDLASSHLQEAAKLRKLLAFCSLAYGLCLSLGIYLHEKVKKVPTRPHGYKKASFARHGLNCLQQLSRPTSTPCQLLQAHLQLVHRWFCWQLAHYLSTKIVG